MELTLWTFGMLAMTRDRFWRTPLMYSRPLLVSPLLNTATM